MVVVVVLVCFIFASMEKLHGRHANLSAVVPTPAIAVHSVEIVRRDL